MERGKNRPETSRRDKVISGIGALVLGSGIGWVGWEMYRDYEPLPEIDTYIGIDEKQRATLDLDTVRTVDWLYGRKYADVTPHIEDGNLTLDGDPFRATYKITFEGAPAELDEQSVKAFLHGKDHPQMTSFYFASATVGRFTVTVDEIDEEPTLSVKGTSYASADSVIEDILSMPPMPLARKIIDASADHEPLVLPSSGQ